LLYELNNDAEYYKQHKVLLVKALKWHRREFNDTLLLRGANLDYFDTWFGAAQKRQNHPPIDKQIEFIKKSRWQAQHKPSETLDVFIAYSRTDSDFVRQLNDYLQYYGNKTTWLDQESIPASADFEQEMLNGIAKSHHFLFIISPQSVNSPFCEKEVEHAQALNKRIITLLYRQPEPFKLHKALKPIHWIDFSKSAHFNRSKADEVIRVLKTDEAYFSQQTKWLLRAQVWLNKKKNEGLLLQGSEFEEAKTWLEAAKTKAPYVHANSLQEQLIHASEYEIKTKVLSDRLSKALWMCGALFMIVLGMSLYAWQQKENAKATKSLLQETNKKLGSLQQDLLISKTRTTEKNNRKNGQYFTNNSILERVRKNGSLLCGGRTDLAGFGYICPDGSHCGFNIDLCRAVTAAVLNSPIAPITLIPVSTADRKTVLVNREVDMLSRNVTWTATRNAEWGNFTWIMFYDGQGFMTLENSGITVIAELDGKKICVVAGTTTEKNLTDYFARYDLTFIAVFGTDTPQLIPLLIRGECDAITADKSILAAIRRADRENLRILDSTISKEPLTPIVPHGDEQWLNIVQTVMFSLINAEELGITQNNVNDMMTSANPQVKQLLGVEGNHFEELGLEKSAIAQAIRAVGNYGEIYERHLGKNGIGIPRGMNKLWKNGGLIYAPPLR
jgi:general L-amino acid transport system substrate-binding protein